jgi:hypothetical protein
MLTNLRLAQIYAVFRLELKRPFSPSGIVGLSAGLFADRAVRRPFAVDDQTRTPCDFGLDTNIFAGVFQLFYLRLAVFFGCLGIFMNLFRGEVLDKSLHFYFLAPIRREVLMAGKFLTG